VQEAERGERVDRLDVPADSSKQLDRLARLLARVLDVAQVYVRRRQAVER